ncbi:MAG: AEC family transporter [Haloarculaceae archaeon]
MAGDSIAAVLTSAIGPPLSVAAAGYLLGRWKDVDVDPLSTVTVYLLLPALVFHSVVTMPIAPGTVSALVATMVLFTGVLAVVAATVGSLAGESGVVLRGGAMAAAIPNAGNFGIPVATFAFGNVGRTTAVLFVLVQNVLMYTVGVYALSAGAAESRLGALARVFRLPLTYAVVVALAVVAADAVPPTDGPVMTTVAMVGDASIPIFLVILGLQLADMRPASALRRTLPMVGVKVLVAPVVALSAVLTVGVAESTAARAFVMLAAGPAGVTPLVLAIEFGEDEEGLSAADYVGTVIFLTIVGSLPVITGLIVLLRTGVLV